MLIALERRRKHVIQFVRNAASDGSPLHIPMAVVAEFWRGSVSRELRQLIEAHAVPDTLRRVQSAGATLSKVPKHPRGFGPGVVDALVAALAADMGDIIVTTDPGDIEVLRAYLPGIAGVLAV